MSIGFGEEEMAEAVADQIRRLSFYSAFVDTTNPPAVELATKLASLAPGDLNRVFYTCSGSAANDTAVRLIHYYNARRGKPEKRHLISRIGSYHGSTYLAMSLTGRESDRSPHFHYVEGIRLACPNCYRSMKCWRRGVGKGVGVLQEFLRLSSSMLLEAGADRACRVACLSGLV